ncbi:MAG: hypothetical protein OEO79_13330 [Gemmatimonadota bacterium]|nr:hypothetical protein [Gemmatimonadota bacterium]
MKRSVWVACCLFIPAPLLAQVGPLVLPGDDVGEPHYGDPPAPPEGAQWLGLYVRGDSSWLQPVNVSFDVRPPDEPDEPGTHEYVVDPRSPSLLMIGVGQARIGAVQSALWYTDRLGAEATNKEFVVGTTEYRVALESTGPGLCDQVVTLTEGARSQRLYEAATDDTFACDEPRFDLHWVGDLDGDGRLDLLATFSPKYSYHPRRLYLSSAAAPGDLVGQVSRFER